MNINKLKVILPIKSTIIFTQWRYVIICRIIHNCLMWWVYWSCEVLKDYLNFKILNINLLSSQTLKIDIFGYFSQNNTFNENFEKFQLKFKKTIFNFRRNESLDSLKFWIVRTWTNCWDWKWVLRHIVILLQMYPFKVVQCPSNRIKWYYDVVHAKWAYYVCYHLKLSSEHSCDVDL